jgi:DHA1 family bicyclomycin/chloramphenicol resistance-like MFS transporter
MKPPRRFALTFLLALLSSTGPLSLNIYLPSLPDIDRSPEASTLRVQLTISSYLFGSAVGRIFYGPMSDRYGRRPLLLAALSLYALATFGCAAAQSGSRRGRFARRADVFARGALRPRHLPPPQKGAGVLEID